MAENLSRSTGRPQEYKFDRGGVPTEFGPYIGIVVNNVDNTRGGRLQVWIEQFGSYNVDGSPNLQDTTVWRTVRYITPFYGATPQSGSAGVGTYPGNRNSYGMWFTPPDLGTRVLCFFVSGDPTAGGYYVGCIPEDGMNHMIPAIGASANYQPGNQAQAQILNGVPLAAVTEINNINQQITDNPRFFDQKKPVQSVVEAIMFQQGLTKDLIRGPIRSSAQRESPSNVYGISTPGKPIYQGGYNDPAKFKEALEKGQVRLQDIAVIGRQGGHTFVMDDGDIEGKDTLVRIRTAKGHQITMSDDGDTLFVVHANGMSWVELGKQGTVDLYAVNSINLRTQGQLNLHGDLGINMYSGGPIRIKSNKAVIAEGVEGLFLSSNKSAILSGKAGVGIRSDSTLALQSNVGSWRSAGTLNLQGSVINLNGATTVPVSAVPSMTNFKLADTTYVQGQGWVVRPGTLETIVTRAPTHQPYPYANQAANVTQDLNPKVPTEAPSTTAGSTYARVSAVPTVENGVTVEQIVKEPLSVLTVGSTTPIQVTALTAQTAAALAAKHPAYNSEGQLLPGWQLDDLGDPYYSGPDIATLGVGVYGQKLDVLVSAGFIKPEALTLVKTGINAATVLNSSGVWTGQLGVNNLPDYLKSKEIQNIAQLVIVAGAFAGLIDQGVISGDEAPRYVATFLQPATEYGVDQVTQWVDGFSTDSVLTRNLEIAARQGQYAIDVIDNFGDDLDFEPESPALDNAVTRDVIDKEVAEVIGNEKIEVPQYTEPPVEPPVAEQPKLEDGTIQSATTPGFADIVSSIASATPAARIAVTRPAVQIVAPTSVNEDGTFRFAPGNKQVK